MLKKKSVLCVILLCFLLVFLSSLPLEVIAANTQWHHFGGNKERQRLTDDGHTRPPLYFKWRMRLGWSISQPIYHDGFFYHIAGGKVYKIPEDMGFHSEGTPASRIMNDFYDKGGIVRHITNRYEARSHPAYDPATDTLYVGMGNSRVYALNPRTLSIRGGIQTHAERLVSAPTILPNGTMAIASDDARVRIYKDLHKGAKNSYVIHDFRGSDPKITITGSPAVNGNRLFVPITFAGKDKAGYVVALDVKTSGSRPDTSVAWIFRTKNGVAASTVYKDGRVYFADKSGAVYAVNAKNGRKIWENTSRYASSSGTTLVNNSPAVVGNYIVIPYRYFKSRGNGRIVALDIRNGREYWSYNPGEEIADAPTLIKDSRTSYYVLFGTVDGHLHTRDLFNGGSRTITYDSNGNRQPKIRVVRTERGSIYQGRGLSTEILPAGQHLLIGGNYGNWPNESENGMNGNLYAYAAGIPNLKIHDIRTRPSEPDRDGDITLQARVENDSSRSISTNMGWRIQNGSMQKTSNFTLRANETKWVDGPTIKKGTLSDDDITLRVWAKINPDENKPRNETTFDDNAMTKDFPLYGGIDLYTEAVTGGKYFKKQKLLTRVNVGRIDKGEAPNTDTKVRLQLRNKKDGSTKTIGSQNVSLVRGQAHSLYFEWEADTAGDFELVAEINPDRSIKETTYTNNVARAPLTVWDKEGPTLCSVSPNKSYGVTGTFTYRGNAKWNKQKERWEYETLTGRYYEHLHASYLTKPEGSFVNDDEDGLELIGEGPIEAGQGFTYEISSEYYDERGRYEGPKKAQMQVPDGTVSKMDSKYALGSNYNEWQLSHAWVAKNGFDVQYTPNKPIGSEEYLFGGRAFYTPMDIQDGPYPFTNKVYEAGKNNLEVCLEGEVIVDGMLFDDFYVRRVYPGNPFPFGVTPMWEGHEHILTDLLDWYEGRED